MSDIPTPKTRFILEINSDKFMLPENVDAYDAVQIAETLGASIRMNSDYDHDAGMVYSPCKRLHTETAIIVAQESNIRPEAAK